MTSRIARVCESAVGAALIAGLGVATVAVCAGVVPGAHPGPTLVAGTAVPATLPACTTEDGGAPDQAFPCLWDAAHQGNGQGDSYILFDVACDMVCVTWPAGPVYDV